jgi:protein-tyrosine-phosphatase
MTSLRLAAGSMLLASAVLVPVPSRAQEMPADYKGVLTTLGKTGDFKDGVLKVNIPRSDLKVTIDKRPAPTPFGFGGWVALTKGDGMDVMMGDLVLTEDEVNPVMSALLQNGLDVTALHNHFFWEQPRIFYMHVHGMGTPADLARRVKPAIDLIDQAAKQAQGSPPAAPSQTSLAIDGAALATIIGTPGEQTGPVYKITIGRPDINVREHGAAINARMGVNTWAAFAGTDADAMVAGDVAMLDNEVTPVLKALRAHGISVVAIHHHMTGVTPAVFFLHYYGTGPAPTLAQGVRAAVDLLAKPRAQQNASPTPQPTSTRVLFLCPHGAAKSVLASAYFQRLAKERGLNVIVESAGTDPDPRVSPTVAAHLAKQGYPASTAKPRLVTAEDLAKADVVVSLGCDLTRSPTPAGRLIKWDDVPGPGEDFARADDAIRRHVTALVDDLINQVKAQRK